MINRPELQLLLLSVYFKPRPHILKTAQQILQSPLQWTEIFSLAKRWQVLSYLYYFVSVQNLQSYVPEVYLKNLKKDYERQAMQTIFLKRQLQDLRFHFTHKQIPYCLIKGAECIETIYKDTPVRPMSDIDILCHPKDINNISEVLASLGYFQKTMHQSHELQSIATYRKHYPAFFHHKKHTIEVHFNLFPGATNQKDLTQELWSHRMPLNHTSQFRLNESHHLLYLCHHLNYHIQSPREGLVLYWFFDIYQWTKQFQLSINNPLSKVLSPKDRKDIEAIFYIIDKQWIKPEMMHTSVIKTEAMLSSVLNQHIQESRLNRIKRVISYYWQLWSDQNPQWSNSERFIYWFRLLFPTFSYIKDRYHVKHKWTLPLYCITNPLFVIFRAIKRLMGGSTG